jgi:hypothetical protein
MKGVVFTEFLEMVTARFGDVVADWIIDESVLPSGGAYTSVGTYDYVELLTLVTKLSAISKIPVPDLVHAYGTHLFGRFAAGYPVFFKNGHGAFPFLLSVHSFIHVEVRKLYPDAELPAFEYPVSEANRLVMIYRSRRPFGDFAAGLLQGCVEYFKEPVEIGRENLPMSDGLTGVRFTLTRKGRG